MKKISTLIMVMFAMFASQSIQAKNNQPNLVNETTTENDQKRDDMRYKKESDPEFKFNVDEITIDVSKEGPYEMPILLNPNKLEVESYGVSHSDLASVDENGVFTINPLNLGDVTFYAKGKGNKKYADSEAQCLVHIVDPSIIYRVVFDIEEDGGWVEESSFPIWQKSYGAMWAYGGYKGITSHVEAYLVSPEITLEGGAFQVTFNHTFVGFQNPEQDAQLLVREVGGEWINIEGIQYPTEQTYSTLNSGKLDVPEELAGKTVEFAFKYCTDGNDSDGNWNVKEFRVMKTSDTPTGITEINVNRNVENNKIYDLQGREIKNPAKGIYIINGKKVILN